MSGSGKTQTLLDERDLAALARGCAVLGAGGGGNPKIGLLIALQAVGEFGPVPLVDLDDLPGNALVLPCGGIGAPTVSLEKIQNGSECERLREGMEALWGQPVAALMCGEIGGSNGVMPVAWAARLGLPLVDADGMGRAFPEIPQVTMELAGIPASPSVMTDERGNVIVFHAVSGRWLERLERSAAVAFGGRGYSAEYALTVEQARSATIRGSVSFALRIGEAIGGAGNDPVGALVDELGAFRLVAGKVVDVERRTTEGFVRGSAAVEGLGPDVGRVIRIEIQNENLVALEEERVLASVPDLISVLDSQTADAITTERLRYGQRVEVIAFPCHPLWRSEAGLELAGPAAFGYGFDYVPVEELHVRAA